MTLYDWLMADPVKHQPMLEKGDVPEEFKNIYDIVFKRQNVRATEANLYWCMHAMRSAITYLYHDILELPQKLLDYAYSCVKYDGIDGYAAFNLLYRIHTRVVPAWNLPWTRDNFKRLLQDYMKNAQLYGLNADIRIYELLTGCKHSIACKSVGIIFAVCTWNYAKRIVSSKTVQYIDNVAQMLKDIRAEGNYDRNELFNSTRAILRTHDEITVRAQQRIMDKTVKRLYKYNVIFEKTIKSVGLELPVSNVDIALLGLRLHNCLARYVDSHESNNAAMIISRILIDTKNNGAIELHIASSDGERIKSCLVNQAKGAYNRDLYTEVQRALLQGKLSKQLRGQHVSILKTEVLE